MEIWLWAFLGLALFAAAVLTAKLYLIKLSITEIEQAFADRLITDTNTLIDISSRDRHMRRLAASINKQLVILRGRRLQYQQGDMELKNAVTNISHDLRTPLTAILGYLELLELEHHTPKACGYIQIIKSRAELMAHLTEELFNYSVILTGPKDTGSMHTGPAVLNTILEESIAAFYTELNSRGISPVVHMPDTKVIRPIDPSAVSRIFSNLMNNAIKYSDGDLEITLSQDGKIAFANKASRLNNILAAKLFDRFYTVESAENSTGLGLTIARTLVEQMKGSIKAEYENGRLCIFILFPDKTK